jgi:pimeloyl-ACP methyl ester carboxylesterase
MRRTSNLPAAILLAATMLAACSSAPIAATAAPASLTTTVAPTPAGAFVPSFATQPCPDDVTTNVVIPVSCGYLTVLEDRAKPAGRTIQVFVARFDPPGGTTTPDPVITLSHLGSQDGYGDMAGGGQRTHRVLYLIDPRGIGHSVPSLDCPEVRVIGPDLAGLRLHDPTRRALLLKAVSACHDRLVGQGIDLSTYDLAANAADIEDLRTALKIGSWNLMTNGDASRLAFEVAQRYPAGLRSLIIDSPNLPSPDSMSIGPEALDFATTRVVSACEAQPACQRAFPDVGAMIRNAISALEAKPVTIQVADTVDAIRLGHPISVVIDGAAIVRILRFSFGSGGASRVGVGLATVRDAVDGKLNESDPNVQAIASDVGDCVGLLPNCERPNLGALYSILCRNYATQPDTSGLSASIAGRPAYQDVFSPSPLLAPCGAWGVTPAAARPSGSPTGGVPTLILRGAFDPYSAPPTEVMKSAAGAPNVYLVDIPNQSYNALGYTECPRAIRNAWIDAPAAAPDTSCLSAIPPIALAP